jgi:hypothetical protein
VESKEISPTQPSAPAFRGMFYKRPTPRELPKTLAEKELDEASKMSCTLTNRIVELTRYAVQPGAKWRSSEYAKTFKVITDDYFAFQEKVAKLPPAVQEKEQYELFLKEQYDVLAEKLKALNITVTTIKRGDVKEAHVHVVPPSWADRLGDVIKRGAAGVGAAVFGAIGLALFPFSLAGGLMILSSYSGSDREIDEPQTVEDKRIAAEREKSNDRWCTAGIILALPFVGCAALLGVAFE